MWLPSTPRGLNGAAKRLGLNEPLNFAKRQTCRTRQGAVSRKFPKLNSPPFSLGGVFRPLNTKRLNDLGDLQTEPLGVGEGWVMRVAP